MNKWEQSIIERLRHGTYNQHAVTLGADEVHIPMNAMLDRDVYREIGTPEQVAEVVKERDELRAGKPMWRPCSDPPPVGTVVLAARGKVVEKAMYQGDEGFATWVDEEEAYCVIFPATHWMPIPNPPEAENQ
jgi:hypothetical protein